MLRKKQVEAELKMRNIHERESEELAEKKGVKLKSITKQEQEVIKNICTVTVMKG